MAECVAEIEQRAAAGVSFVLGDKDSFRQAALFNCVQAGCRVALEYPRPMSFEPIEEGGIAQKTVFHHFGIAGAQLARVQRIKHVGVDQHEARLMEGADQVLAMPRVDAGFAADGGVDLGEQRRGDLHQAHAAFQDAGGESGEVADDAAAERDDNVAAIEPPFQQRVA